MSQEVGVRNPQLLILMSEIENSIANSVGELTLAEVIGALECIKLELYQRSALIAYEEEMLE